MSILTFCAGCCASIDAADVRDDIDIEDNPDLHVEYLGAEGIWHAGCWLRHTEEGLGVDDGFIGDWGAIWDGRLPTDVVQLVHLA